MKNILSIFKRAVPLRTIVPARRYFFSSITFNLIPQRSFHSNLSLSKENNKYEISQLEQSQYYNLSEETMTNLLDQLEDLVQSIDEDNQYDVEYSSGVLNLNLGSNGTFVINKQPPNKQIWLSSPISGPKRYDYCSNAKVWFYSRDQSTLNELLSVELSGLLNKNVVLQL